MVVGSPGILVKEFGANSQTRSSAGICPVGPSGSIQYCPDLVTPAIPNSSQLFAAYYKFKNFYHQKKNYEIE